MVIRDAVAADVDQMVELGLVMWKESPHYSKYGLDEEKVRMTVLHLINSDKGVAIVAESSEKEIIGVFIGMIDEQWFGRTLTLYDLALFVHPTHRSVSRAAVMVMRKAIAVGKEKGAKALLFGNSTGVDPERVGKFFQFFGMHSVGGIWAMDLGD